MEIRIRPAKLSEINIIADFNARLAQETEQLQLDLGRVRAGVAALLSDPAKGTYFIAEAQGTPAPPLPAPQRSEGGLVSVSATKELAGEDAGAPRIAGQLLITYEWSDWRNGNFWWIQSVYVDRGFRGQGVFRALFEHVHALAKAQTEVCGLRLYMDAHNATARRSYERLGMKRTNYELFEMDFVLSHL